MKIFNFIFLIIISCLFFQPINSLAVSVNSEKKSVLQPLPDDIKPNVSGNINHINDDFLLLQKDFDNNADIKEKTLVNESGMLLKKSFKSNYILVTLIGFMVAFLFFILIVQKLEKK